MDGKLVFVLVVDMLNVRMSNEILKCEKNRYDAELAVVVMASTSIVRKFLETEVIRENRPLSHTLLWLVYDN